MADMVPFWWVSFEVALAWSMPTANPSASTSAATSLCLSLEVQDCLAGMSSEASSCSDLVTWEFALLRLDDKIAQGQLPIKSSNKFPWWLDDVALRETWVGFQSDLEVD